MQEEGERIIQTYGTNSTHYSSISLVPFEDTDYTSLDNITAYGETGGEAAYATPVSYGLIQKCVDAVMTTDDFQEWDYCESETVETFTVWNSDGTALWTTEMSIDYCYCNMAIEVNPIIIVDGVEYHIAAVAALSTFDAFSDTYDGDEHILTYIGTTINKVHLAELDEDGKYIVTIPRITGFSNSTDVSGGYAIFNMEYITTIYENEESDIIHKIQPIYINQP